MPHEQGKSQTAELFVRGTREEILKKPGYGLRLLKKDLEEYHIALDAASQALYRNDLAPADAAEAWKTARGKYSAMQVVEVPITVKTDADLEDFKAPMKKVSNSAPRGSYEFDVSQSGGVVTIKLKAAPALADRIEIEYERQKVEQIRRQVEQKGESVKVTIAEGVERLRAEKEESERQKVKLQRWNSLEGLPPEFVEYFRAEALGENIQINEYLARKEVVDKIGALKTVWESYTANIRPGGSVGRAFRFKAKENVYKFIYENPEGAAQAISELVKVEEALGGLTGGERKVLYSRLNVADDEIYQKPVQEVLQKAQALRSKPRSDKLGRGWARVFGYQARMVEEFLRENSAEDAAVVLDADKRKGWFRYDFDSAVADEFAEKFLEFYTRKVSEKRKETVGRFKTKAGAVASKAKEGLGKVKKSYLENPFYQLGVDFAVALGFETTALGAALAGAQPAAVGVAVGGGAYAVGSLAKHVYNNRKLEAVRGVQSALIDDEVVFEPVVEESGPATEVEPEYLPNYDAEELRRELLGK